MDEEHGRTGVGRQTLTLNSECPAVSHSPPSCFSRRPPHATLYMTIMHSSTDLPPLAPAMSLPPVSHHPSLPSSSSSNSENSTPVPPGSAKKHTAKRKRTGDSTDNGDAGSQTRTRDGPKKKKANRACFHCQKAHLTCDDCKCLAMVLLLAICACTFALQR